MANRKITYEVGFTGDTSQLQAALRQAQQALQQIANIRMNQGVTSDIAEAARAAKELQQYLYNAVNLNTGKLDLSRFIQSLQQGNTSLQDYYNKLQAIGSAGADAFLKVASAISAAEIPIARSNAALDKLWVTMKNTMRWRLTTGVLNSFIGGLQSAYGYAKDLNESLNNIRIVTGQSTEQMAEFAKEANKAASALSTTTTNYTDASLIYYQQGLNDKEVQERTNATIKLANVTGQSAETVSSQMTAIWNNFKDGTKTLENYEDVMVALGATTASSSKEIAEGIEKFAPVSQAVGLSFDYAAAALATLVSTTRESASVAGNALKTLFSRLEGLKLGDTLEDGTDLNKYSQALYTVGIDIKDVNGNLKDMDTILDELGEKWQTLAKDEQMALAETVGGVRQYTQLVALMDNWETFRQNLLTAQTSNGALEKQASIFAESWKAARNEVKNASQDIYDSLVNEDFFIGFDRGLADFLHGVATSVDAIGGMKGAITLLGSTFLTLFQDKIAKSLNDLAYNIDFVTGKAQKSQMLFKESAATLAYAMATDSAGSSDRAMNVAQIQAEDVQMQNILNGLAKELTEEQYKQLTYVKDTVTQVKELAFEYQETQGPLDETTAKLKESLETTKGFNKTVAGSLRSFQSLAGTIETFPQNLRDIFSLQFGAGGGVAFGKSGLANYENLVTIFEQLNSKIGGLKTLRIQIEGLDKDLNSSSEAVRQVKKDFQQLTGINLQGSTTEEWLKQLEAILQKVENAANKAGNLLKTRFQDANLNDKEIRAIEQAVDGLAAAAQRAAENGQQMNGALAVSQDAFVNFTKNIQDSLNSTMSFSQSLVTIANGMMRLGMLVQSIKNLGSIWNRDDLTLGEKWTQTLTSVGMIIPSLITLYKVFTQVQKRYTVEVIKGTGAEAQDAVAKLNNAKATVVSTTAVEGNTVAVVRNTKAWLSNPIGWVVLAITAVIAAYTIYTNTIEKNTEAQRKNSQAAADAAKQHADTVQEEIKNNEDLYKSYLEQRTVIDQTEETKQQLYDTTKQLCEAYNVESSEIAILTDRYEELEQSILDARKAQVTSGIKTAKDVINTQQEAAFYAGIDYNTGPDNQGITLKRNLTKNANFEYAIQNSIAEAVKQVGAYASNLGSSTFISGIDNKEEFADVYQALAGVYKYYTDTASDTDKLGSQIYQNLKSYLNDLEPYFTEIKNQQELITQYEIELAEIAAQTAYPLSNVDDLNSYIQARNEFITRLQESISQEAYEEQLKQDGTWEPEKNYSQDYLNYIDDIADGWLRSYSHLKEYASQAKLLEEFLGKLQERNNGKQLSSEIESQVQGIIENERYGKDIIRQILLNGLEDIDLSDFERSFDTLYKKALAAAKAENFKIEIPIVASSISNLESGKDLEEDQLEELEALEKEYTRLGAIRDRTSSQYIQALRDIREGMEKTVSDDALNKLQEAWKRIEKLQEIQKEVQKNLPTKLNLVIDDSQFAQAMSEIMSADYEVEIAIKADIESDLDDAIRHAQGIETAGNLIAEGFQVAAENIEAVQEAFPGILAGYTVTAEGMIQLDSDIAQASIDLAKTQIEAEIEAARSNVQAYKEVLLSKAAAMRTIAEGLQKLLALEQQGNIDRIGYSEDVAEAKGLIENGVTQMHEAAAKEQELISGGLAASEIEDVNQVQTAQNDAAVTSANNWADAYQSMAENSAKWARIAIANAKKVQEALNNAAKGQLIPEKAISEVATSGGIFSGISGGFESAEYKDTYEVGKSEQISWADFYEAGKVLPGDLRLDAYQQAIDAAIAEAQQYEEAAVKLDAYLARLDAMGAGLTNLVNGIGQPKDEKGGKEPAKASLDDPLKQIKEALERYHEITKEIEYQERVLKKLDKQIERTYGLDRLELYAKELEKIDNLISLYQQKNDAAKGFLAIDALDLERLGLIAEIDPESLKLNNYTALLAQSQNDYQQAVDTYNQWITDVWNQAETKEDQDALEATKKMQKELVDAAKELYEEREAALKSYEDSVENFLDTQESIEDLLRQRENTKLNEITYRMDVILDVRDARKQIRDFSKEIAESFGDALTHGLQTASLGWDQAKDEMAMYKEYVQEYNDLKGLLDNATEFTDTTAIIDELKELEGNIIESGQRLLEWSEQVENMFVEALSAAADRFSYFTNQLEHNDAILSTMKELYALQGQTYKTQQGFNRLQRVAQERLETQVGQAKLQRKWFEEADVRLQEAQAQLDALIAEKGAEAEQDFRYDTFKKNRDALLKEQQEAQKAMLSAAQQAMETAQQMYLDQIEKAVYEFGQALSGGIGLDLLQDKYDHYIEEEERYLDKVNEAYQVAAWYDKLQKDIDNTSNKLTKDRLKALQEEIDIRREGNTLSQYDLDILEAKYKVLQAQADLEDAQNAKSQLRLVRDSQGNWNYQFTTNPDDIAAKEQELLQAENEWYNIAKEQTKEVTGEIIATWQECQEAINEIYSDTSNFVMNEETGRLELTKEAQERETEIRRFYAEKVKFLEEEKQIAIGDMTEAGNQAMIHMAIAAGETVEDITGITGRQVENLVETTGLSSQQLLQLSLSQIEDILENKLEDLANDLGISADELKDMLQRKEQGIESDADAAFKAILESADPATVDLYNLFAENWSLIGSLVGETSSGIKGNIADTYNKIQSGLNDTGTAMNLFDNIFAKDLTDMTKATGIFEVEFDKAVENMQNSFDNYGETITDVADDCGVSLEALDDSVNMVSDSTDRMIWEGLDAAQAIWDQVDATWDAQQGYLDLAAAVWEYIYALQELAAERVVPTIEEASGVDTFKELSYDEGDLSQKMAAALYNDDIESYNKFKEQREKAVNDAAAKGYELNTNEVVEETLQDLSRDLLKAFALGLEEAKDILRNPTKYSQEDWKKIHGITGTETLYGYATGGYTGDFDGGKLAILHEKELVLNAEDTQNILSAVSLVRSMDDIFGSIAEQLDGDGLAAMALLGSRIGGIGAPAPASTDFEQHVTIESVSFPGVTSSREIEEAFESLVNDAAQWARRRKS